MLVSKIGILSFAALFVVASGPSAPASAPAPLQSCGGCVPSGDSSSTSTGEGLGFVSMTTTLVKGRCKWVLTNEDWQLACIQFKGCTMSTTTTWSGLEVGAKLDQCVREGDDITRCRTPALTVDLTGGGLILDDDSLPCGSGGESTLVYSVVTESGDLSASATVSCSPCGGS